jgi:molecular chaperone DnaK (HSP70)
MVLLQRRVVLDAATIVVTGPLYFLIDLQRRAVLDAASIAFLNPLHFT